MIGNNSRSLSLFSGFDADSMNVADHDRPPFDAPFESIMYSSLSQSIVIP